ncbi:Histone-like transcription factor [Spraguea lophii 42_110]|uniref:Histone-like transcription factor n=1 Tax=Spraguea lophii (strain 42_110) TaxID=1358809 RepID=S7WAW1_SPRLO|nr:Histone-like transcription factor [Spraguea lophii 42_110]
MKHTIKKKCRFPAARLKRIMQGNDDIGKISVSAPVVIGKATELFIEEFTMEVVRKMDKKTKRITTEDIKKCVLETERFVFLKNALGESIEEEGEY